jgi:hypothetical protein
MRPEMRKMYEAEVVRWLEEAVIGLNLCPFAAAPWRRGLVRIVISTARDMDEALEDAADEINWLIGIDGDDEETPVSTTLIAYPAALADFEEYLEAVAIVEAGMKSQGLHGVLQVATFHPDYRFRDVDPDDAGNWTNRSPYPILHLLREAELDEATTRHPNVESIPATNIAKMRALSLEARLRLRGGRSEV